MNEERCRHDELPDTLWPRLRQAEDDVAHLLADKTTLAGVVTEQRLRAEAAEQERDYWKEQAVMTPATVRRVPNQPKTPLKSFRIPQALYEAAQAKAAEKGESVSDVVRRALERYVKQK